MTSSFHLKHKLGGIGAQIVALTNKIDRITEPMDDGDFAHLPPQMARVKKAQRQLEKASLERRHSDALADWQQQLSALERERANVQKQVDAAVERETARDRERADLEARLHEDLQIDRLTMEYERALLRLKVAKQQFHIDAGHKGQPPHERAAQQLVRDRERLDLLETQHAQQYGDS